MPSKSTIDASAFLDAVTPDIRPFVEELHARMLEAGCALRIKEAKSGYMVSYSAPRTKKALANFCLLYTSRCV